MAAEQAYGEDLAYIHDVAYGDVARDAAERLIAELARSGRRDGTVVDLGCGPGVLAERLTDAGYHVVGVDLSDAMIARARERAPSAEFQAGSFISLVVPKCVAVTAIGEVLSYSIDPANDDRARADFFKRTFDALVPGGCLLFDIAGPQRVKPGGPHRTFAEGADWAVLVETESDARARQLTRRITSFRRLGALYRRSTEVHTLALLDPHEVVESLRSAGFAAQVIPAYGVARPPDGIVIFLARKLA